MSNNKIYLADMETNYVGLCEDENYIRLKEAIEPISLVKVLVVGAGGGGGIGRNVAGSWAKGGGGGGGTYAYSTGYTLTSITYSVIVGIGGAGGGNPSTRGGTSTFATLSSTGGYGGAMFNGGKDGSGVYIGGNGSGSGTSCTKATGGGGGGSTSNCQGEGNVVGGNGYACDISGSKLYYGAGGMGGNNYSPDPGTPSGYTNYGCGGNGDDTCDATGGDTGYNGIVIIRYTSTSQAAIGGDVIYQLGGDWVHIFTSSGTFEIIT